MSYSQQLCPLSGTLYITQVKLKSASKSHLVYNHARVYTILHRNQGQQTHPVGSKYGENNL